MAPEIFVDIFRDALFTVLIMVSAIILPSLLVGLTVAVFQAATSINEQTLSFLPRLLTTILSLMFTAHWLVGMVTDFAKRLIFDIPLLVG